MKAGEGHILRTETILSEERDCRSPASSVMEMR